jgi:hypothetical protein
MGRVGLAGRQEAKKTHHLNYLAQLDTKTVAELSNLLVDLKL